MRWPYHCSPTCSAPFLRPLPPGPRGMKRAGSKGARSRQAARPSRRSSAMALPLAGAQRMPQQLCPAEMYAPLVEPQGPIRGSASGATGRMQAWAFGSAAAKRGLMARNAAVAAATRAGSANTASGGNLQQIHKGQCNFERAYQCQRVSQSGSSVARAVTYSPARSLSGVTYSLPPRPHRYTSPLVRG